AAPAAPAAVPAPAPAAALAVAVVAVAEWHVQIARDEAFRDVVADTRAPAATKRVELRASAPGRWYVRVSAVDDDRFEGPFGAVARVLVVGVTATPLAGGRRRFDVAPADAWCVRVGNVPLAHVNRS